MCCEEGGWWGERSGGPSTRSQSAKSRREKANVAHWKSVSSLGISLPSMKIGTLRIDTTMGLPRSVFLRHCRTNNLPVPSIQSNHPLRGLRQTTCLRWNSTSTTNPKLPVQIPSSGAVNLTSVRGLLAIHGPDAAKFLQGLITKIFPSETEPNGLFTSFLSPQVHP